MHGDHMMLRTLIALAALALPACMHTTPAPASAACPANAPAEVAQTMRDMYAALMTDDLNAWRAVTTQDFFAYDVGQRFDSDALLDLIKVRHHEGFVFEWNVNDPKVEVDCNVALVTYVNTGSVTQAGAKRLRTWLESATLRHDGRRWRVRFFHSTSVPPPQQ